MAARTKLYAAVSILVGLTYGIVAVSGATGIVWIIPAMVGGAAYSMIAVFSRPSDR